MTEELEKLLKDMHKALMGTLDGSDPGVIHILKRIREEIYDEKMGLKVRVERLEEKHSNIESDKAKVRGAWWIVCVLAGVFSFMAWVIVEIVKFVKGGK